MFVCYLGYLFSSKLGVAGIPIPDVDSSGKRRCVAAGRQVAGVLPGPGELLPAEDREARRPGVPQPAAQPAHRPRLLRAGDAGDAVRYVAHARQMVNDRQQVSGRGGWIIAVAVEGRMSVTVDYLSTF